MKDVRYERLNPERLADLRLLSNRTFGTTYSKAYFQKKYDTAYTGLQHPSFIAYHHQQPVGFFGALPQLADHHGETVLTATTCEYITHPEYRRQGIHRNLMERSFACLQENGVRFVHSLMNDDSYRAGKGTGFLFRDQMASWNVPIQKIRTLAMRRKLLRNKLTEHYLQRKLAPMVLPVGKFVNQFHREGFWGIRYDEKFSDYKCFTSNYQVQLEGGDAWIKPDTDLKAGALSYRDKSDIPIMIQSLIALGKSLGCRNLILITEADSTLHNALSKMYTPGPAWFPAVFALDGAPSDLHLFRNNFVDFDTF